MWVLSFLRLSTIFVNYLAGEKYEPIKTPLKVAEKEWTGKSGAWVNNTNPFAFEINNSIKAKLEVLDKLVRGTIPPARALHIR